MLSVSDLGHIVVEVPQIDFGEVEHENGIFCTAMRNGNSIMMNIVQ